MAHDNVRRLMQTGLYNELFQAQLPPSPAKALPVVTFNDSLTFHLNGEDVVVFHVARAHTSGDAIVWFRKANVVHMGDCLFNGMYPVIDRSSGGSIDGMIAAANRVLPLLKDDTKVIAGHGPLTDRQGLLAYRDMLVGLRGAVAAHVKAKHTLEQTLAAKPTTPWDAKWGKGFIKPEAITRVIWRDLTKQPLVTKG